MSRWGPSPSLLTCPWYLHPDWMLTTLSLSSLFAGQTLCPWDDCEGSHWSLMPVRANKSRPWELTVPNPGPQCPQWPQTQVPRLDGTQSCESQRTWSPARLTFLYSPLIWALRQLLWIFSALLSLLSFIPCGPILPGESPRHPPHPPCLYKPVLWD